MIAYLWVALGGALGSVLRYWLGGLIAEKAGTTFPLGTLTINVTGSFLIGLFAALHGDQGRALASPGFRQFFMIGICGGYTTFSTFSLETLNLAREGEFFYAGGNVIFSVILCLVAVWLGWLLVSIFNSAK